MKLPKVDKHPIATYTDEELEKLLKKPNINKCSFVEYRNYVMVAMFLSTGIRLSSLINIRVKDINFDDEVVNIMHTIQEENIMAKVKLIVTESKCRNGYCKKGDEYIVQDICPPICHELWNCMYPMVYSLLNGGKLDYGASRTAQFDIKCHDNGRVCIHGERIG